MIYRFAVLILLTGLLLSFGMAQEPSPNKPVDPPLHPAIVKLRLKLNPEFPPWSPEQVIERVAEHLASYQAELVAKIVGDPGQYADQQALEKARQDALNLARYEASYLRYFSLAELPRVRLPEGISSLFFTENHASAAPIVYRPIAAPNTDNRLFFVDIRKFCWNAEIFENISKEDPYYREPLISSDCQALHYVRDIIGNGVIRGDWFVYYTGDTTEFLKVGEIRADNAFYYQLLYANNFTVKEVEKVQKVKYYYQLPNGDWKVDANGEYLFTEKEEKVKVKQKVFGAIPQNVADFQKFWRIDRALVDAADFYADRGGVIDENVSQVSYSNRIIQRVNTALGPYWRTFDVFRTAGDQDFFETLPVPLQDKKNFKFDAGEHIFFLNGKPIYLLSDGTAQGENRVEFGDPRVVRDQMSGNRLIVLTWKSCVSCHDQGVIPLSREPQLAIKGGVKLNLRYDKEFEKKAFYLSEINKLVRRDQEDYADFVREATGLTSQEMSSQYQRFRGWYWSPVTLDQAARECGTNVEELMDAIQVTAKGRIARLLTTKVGIPRVTWERGLFQETFLLLMEYRKAVNKDRIKRGLPPISITSYRGHHLPEEP